MADLKNSQRISYKATLVQVNPSVIKEEEPKNPKQEPKNPKEEPKHPHKKTKNSNYIEKKLKRAIEKSAFVQSFRITKNELNHLKEHYFNLAKETKEERILAVYTAIESLVEDRTSTSTLNNASNFAEINYTLLIDVANLIIDHRDSIAGAINHDLAKISTKYKASQIKSVNPESSTAEPSAPKPDNIKARSKTEFITNTDGLPIKKISFLSTTVKPERKPLFRKIGQINSFGALISTDSSKFEAGHLLPSLNLTSQDSYQPSIKEAIEWAERQENALFTRLFNLIEPYLMTSSDVTESMGRVQSINHFMSESFSINFNKPQLQGAVKGFETRMHIEPIGHLHLERIEMYPVGIERGELIHSVPLAPSETVNISHKEWSVRQQEFEDIVQDSFEGYSEEGVAEKNDISMSNESQTKHATALNVGASLSASYSSVTLSTSFGYNATSDDQESKKDSRNHSMAITKKAAARTKKDHKISFKVSSVIGSEDQSVRMITNPSDVNSMRIDYFQLARKWKVNLLRYGLRMTYDIVIPNPGAEIVTKVNQVRELDAIIDLPFTFKLPLSSITYNSLATDPLLISNYDKFAAENDATVTAPPVARKSVNAHKETTTRISDSDYDTLLLFDYFDFEIDENYYINDLQMEMNYETLVGETRSYLTMLDGKSIYDGLSNLIGKSGKLSIDFMRQFVYTYAINVTFNCRPKVQFLLEWRLQVWNQIRQAAEEKYFKGIQNYKDQRAKLIEEINGYDALTLRRMEQEEIMKGVLRWLLGPSFYIEPSNISSLFTQGVLDPNVLSDTQWKDVMEHGEFIKYLHNAVEWENVLYFTYPYFWDDKSLWEFKKFLYHPDPTHRVFLRSGTARVVLTVRPGYETTFSQLVESGTLNPLPGSHPYTTIAEEIQNFAKTNYPGFPPANPEQNARPQLYLEQRKTWKEMQYIIQLLEAYRADDAVSNGFYPTTAQGFAVLQNYMAAVNAANAASNANDIALNPLIPLSSLLPTYIFPNVPLNDHWGTPYFYKSPGDTGDYDLISFGANGVAGGIDKDADIAANSEASLVSTWFEYTPTGALDIGITSNPPNITPIAVKPDMA